MQTTSNYRASAEECKQPARNAMSEEQGRFLMELAETWIAERRKRIEQIGRNAVEEALASHLH